jgi:hypothetical protein
MPPPGTGSLRAPYLEGGEAVAGVCACAQLASYEHVVCACVCCVRVCAVCTRTAIASWAPPGLVHLCMQPKQPCSCSTHLKTASLATAYARGRRPHFEGAAFFLLDVCSWGALRLETPLAADRGVPLSAPPTRTTATSTLYSSTRALELLPAGTVGAPSMAAAWPSGSSDSWGSTTSMQSPV